MIDFFYLQDSRSNTGSRAMFWRNGGGYTSNLDEAELFTMDEAVRQYECRDTDLPWPQVYIEARTEIGVDSQYITKSEAAVDRNEDGRIYVSFARSWDGNDLVWVSGTGAPTSNLEDAIHPGKAESAHYLARGFEVWPCGYIVMRSRNVVRADQLDHKQALRGAGLKLPKVKRQRIRRYTANCGGCGRFLSERQVYGDCPNCGEGNAP